MSNQEVTRKVYLYLSFLVWLTYFIAIMTKFRVLYYAVAGLSVLTLLLSMAGRIRLGRVLSLSLPILSFYLYLLLTSTWSLYPEETQYQVMVELLYPLMFSLSLVSAVNFNGEEITRQFLLYPWAISILYLYLYLTYGAIRPYDQETAMAIGATANICALYLSLSMLFLGWRARELGKGSKVTLVVSALLLLLSQSRTGYICLFMVVMVLVYVYSDSIQSFLSTIARTAFLIVVSLGVAMLFPATADLLSDGWERLAEQANPTDFGEIHEGRKHGDDVERKRMYYAGWEAFKEHPVLGIGYYSLQFYIEDNYGTGLGKMSHNLLITLVAEAGWPALFIFAWLVWRYMQSVSRLKARATRIADQRLYRLCGWAMLLMMVISIFHPLLQFSPLFLILGWVAGAEHYAPVENRSAANSYQRWPAGYPARAAL
jgi:O-antigen ligase